MHQSYKLVLTFPLAGIDETSYHYSYNQVWLHIRQIPFPENVKATVYFRSALADVFGGQSEELVYQGRALSY